MSTKLDSSVLEKWIATGRKTVTRPLPREGGKKVRGVLFGGNWPSRKSLFDSILMARIVAFAINPTRGHLHRADVE